MASRTPPTAVSAPYASLEQMLSASETALQALRQVLAKGGGSQLSVAIMQAKEQGLNPDHVVFRCSSLKGVFWYQPAALVLATARPNAHVLLRVMLDHGLDITQHRCGPLEAGEFRTLAHAFVQGWSTARPAAIKKLYPASAADIFAEFDPEDHRLDSRALHRLLAQVSLDWAAPASNGQTILHQAMTECEIKDLRTIFLLAMAKGVPADSRDRQGKSAIDLGRLRLAQEQSPADRETLQSILVELSHAAMADNTCYSGAERRAQPRI